MVEKLFCLLIHACTGNDTKYSPNVVLLPDTKWRQMHVILVPAPRGVYCQGQSCSHDLSIKQIFMSYCLENSLLPALMI